MESGWNPAKCARNISERGIDFADVLVAFADPMKKGGHRRSQGLRETRCNMLAKATGRIFHLTFTGRGVDLDHLCKKSQQTGATAI